MRAPLALCPVLGLLRRLAVGVVLPCATVLAAPPAHAQDAAVVAPRTPAVAPLPARLTVRFHGREIDLQPFYEGFPYVRFRAKYAADALLYFRDTRAGRWLTTLPLGAPDAHGPDAPALALDQGTPLGTVDWNTRGLRDVQYNPPTHEYVVLADDANEERFNLFALRADTGALRRLTDKPYVYGYGIDKQHHTLAYVARYGAGPVYHSCLNLYDLGTGAGRELVCDTPAQTFTWTEVNFRPDGAGVVLSVLRAGDRNHEGLAYVSLVGPPAGSPPVLLTDLSVRRRNVGTVREWLDDSRFVYTSDESGFTNVYVYDLARHQGQGLTHFTEDVDDVVPLVVAGRALLGAMIKRPYESELYVLDALTGAVLGRHTFDATATFLDYTADRALIQTESRRARFALDEATVTLAQPDRATIVLARRAGVPPGVAAQIERCDVARVRVPTFDTDPHTGQTRLLDAYLQTPRGQDAPAPRVALIEAFYGGANVFDTTAQVYCAAGAAVLSPAVRGSAGYGAEFAALNDHDLGGNEVLDLIYAGRFLTRRLGLQESRVGLMGGSHGGYEVMRALTLPPEVNGHREAFHWGFGVAFYGFSSILTFYQTSNIPDWVLLEAGDPATDAARLRDRSPLTHAADAAAPLLLLHGDADNRVPVGESRQMVAALRAARRPVTYVEFAGQGHGLKGLANQYRAWTAVFAFLDRTLPVAATRVAAAPRARRGLAHRGRYAAAVVLLALLVAGAWAYDRRAAGR